MTAQLDEGQMSMRHERMLGVVLLVTGLMIAGVAVSQMDRQGQRAGAGTPQTRSPQCDAGRHAADDACARAGTPAEQRRLDHGRRARFSEHGRSSAGHRHTAAARARRENRAAD